MRDWCSFTGRRRAWANRPFSECKRSWMHLNEPSPSSCSSHICTFLARDMPYVYPTCLTLAMTVAGLSNLLFLEMPHHSVEAFPLACSRIWIPGLHHTLIEIPCFMYPDHGMLPKCQQLSIRSACEHKPIWHPGYLMGNSLFIQMVLQLLTYIMPNPLWRTSGQNLLEA